MGCTIFSAAPLGYQMPELSLKYSARSQPFWRSLVRWIPAEIISVRLFDLTARASSQTKELVLNGPPPLWLILVLTVHRMRQRMAPGTAS